MVILKPHDKYNQDNTKPKIVYWTLDDIRDKGSDNYLHVVMEGKHPCRHIRPLPRFVDDKLLVPVIDKQKSQYENMVNVHKNAEYKEVLAEVFMPPTPARVLRSGPTRAC